MISQEMESERKKLGYDSCTDKSCMFTFLDVTYADDLHTLKGDGILGLSAGPLGENPHELIVPYLFYKGIIPFNIF